MLDRTKLNLDMSALGLSGNELEELLMERGIFVELVTGNIIMCMTGIGTTREHIAKLLEALDDISSGRELTEIKEASADLITLNLERRGVPEEKEARPLGECAGLVCAVPIIPYPPGIPIACPGEVLTEELISYVKKLRKMGEKVIGVSSEGEIYVGR